MSQRNEKYSTVRRIRRRPVFVSSADAQKIRTSKRPNNNQNFKALPKHWDKSLIPETGHKKIVLQSSTEEYQKILDLFQKTMRGFKIHNIERIQNRSLWEVFQWQRDQMKKINTGKYSVEKFLFHGTDSKHVDSICKQNFDWRICGTHGTAYGKGSYFARDAKYSHSYTSSSGLKTMFVCRVLVGEYTKGNPSYARPPSKDGGDTIFYDSCVDDVRNPSIFVVFEKHQVYPEYLIQYDEDTWSSNTVTTYSLFSNPVQAPPSSSATSFALYNQLQAPLSSSATSSALSNQLQVPPSSSATSSALSKQVQAPPSSSATSSALSKQLQAPPSSSATSSALSNQLQVPPSSSAISSALSNQLQAPASSGAISSKSSVNVIPTQLYWTSNSTQSSYSTNPSSSKSLYSPTHNTTTQYSGSTATYSFTQVGSKGTSTRPTTQSGSTSNYNQPYVYSKGTSSLMQESSQAGSRSNLSQGSSQAGSLRRQPATTPRYIVTSQKKDCIIL